MEGKFGWTSVALEPKPQLWTFQTLRWTQMAKDGDETRGIVQIYCHTFFISQTYFTITSQPSPAQLPLPLGRINPDPTSAPSSSSLRILVLLMPLYCSYTPQT